ncbi:DNA helicase RecQ [Galbibacter sp. EGI 63066]|uniref:DNA helicase RecQ n=1 Tax=Galbibacter sp. EGI 63066 TaxID=2993559 RepID=UPI0022487C1F|nr:DNA helicase RecQ [Galbibacter sp. EGI 63066]MCX2680080.1 DNA helicase RecQ [Galbibacter sp. EGI 63066]
MISSQEQSLILLKKYFGFDAFLPNQEAIINSILDRKDLLGIMPTGGGKSVCFQLPALQLSGTAIVISPLIALMKDQVDALSANGIPAAFYNSSQATETQNETLKKLQAQELKLLYVAPESLSFLMPFLNEENVSLFAVDEAHCISAWGHDFRPAYTQLGQLKDLFPNIPIAAFTATADSATQDDILKQLHIEDAERHIASFDRKNLFLEVRPGTKRFPQIVQFLESRTDQSGIIYCLSRKGTEKLAEKLNSNGFTAQAYHAGIDTETRNRVQEDFVNDRTPIIVATIAFGMGIDKSNVRWVIHYNMPKNIESYYQEIGRSGRDRLPAHTLLFYSFADVITLRKFIDESQTKEVQLAKLERMQQFAEALSCRRIALLNYFGEHVSESCGNCDNCKTPPQFFDGTILAQKVCSAVYRLKEQEALTMLVDVLRGAQNANVFDKDYQHIKTYGAVKDVSWQDMQQYIIQMVNQGILEIRFHENGRLLLTPLAKQILFEDRKVQLATLQKAEKLAKKTKRTEQTKAGLFDKLKTLRTEIAVEEKVPAYIVFSDAALRDMEAKLPETEAEFMEVSGVGEAKKDKYATRFLKVINAWVASKQSTHELSFSLFEKGLTVPEIAEQRGLKKDTIYGHFQKMHQEGESVDLHQFISEEEISKVKKAKIELGDEAEGLKPYFQYFDEQMPYWKIRMGLYLLGGQSVKN